LGDLRAGSLAFSLGSPRDTSIRGSDANRLDRWVANLNAQRDFARSPISESTSRNDLLLELLESSG
jgi:hypothetical protein